MTEQSHTEDDLGLAFAQARRGGLAVLAADDASVRVAARSDFDPLLLGELRRHFGRPVRLERQADDRFEALLRERYERGSNAAMAAAAEFGADANLADVADALPEPADLLESEDDAPIIRLINAILTEAVKKEASDVHIEPFESRLAVRFRIDGVLREMLSPEAAIAGLVVSRIKVMANLDIAEKRLPQDGRIALKIAGRPVDVRVSTIPSTFGERVVLRLLDKQAGRLELAELGLGAELQQRFDALIHKPHGIVLVTGPTGSGKTTTLYAALTRLNDRTRNIMTVEDPIEYHLEGVGQTQVNAKIEMSFARGLRAILRQDPDVVMVGEIRDAETAQIAIQASLTGHLVLSTLHTNTAVGAIARLRDMGIEPFLLSSSLVGVLAQRLVRRLDPTTRQRYTPDAATLSAFGITGQPPTVYRPNPDAPLGGYRGRTGIYELITIDEQARGLIHDSAGEGALASALHNHIDMRTDGWHKIVTGVTSVEEVLRVTQEQA